MSPAVGPKAKTVFVDPGQDDYVAAVCHNLRTPLTAALGFLQLARREAERAGIDSTAHLNMVDQQLRRMASMLDDLAAKSRTQ